MKKRYRSQHISRYVQKRLEQPKQSAIVQPDVDLIRGVSQFAVSPNDVGHTRVTADVPKFGDEI